MGYDVRIVDDCLPADIYERVARLVARELERSYRDRHSAGRVLGEIRKRLKSLIRGAPSAVVDSVDGQWSKNFVSADRHNLADLSARLKASPALAELDDAWRFLNEIHVPGSILVGCGANAGRPGAQDDLRAESGRSDEHTVVVYLNDRWAPEWGGETAYLNQDGDLVTSVFPRRNRAVIASANLRRVDRRVSEAGCEQRMTIGFRIRERRAVDFEDLSAFLYANGAAERGHAVGSLHDHLVRTYSILESRGFGREVSLGGGLHSIYGTSRYHDNIVDTSEREGVAQRFGRAAETFAYLFSILDRPRSLEAPLHLDADRAVVALRDRQSMELSRRTFDDLRRIECANLADQDSLKDCPVLEALWNRSS